jgi:hypothetical protein
MPTKDVAYLRDEDIGMWIRRAMVGKRTMALGLFLVTCVVSCGGASSGAARGSAGAIGSTRGPNTTGSGGSGNVAGSVQGGGGSGTAGDAPLDAAMDAPAREDASDAAKLDGSADVSAPNLSIDAANEASRPLGNPIQAPARTWTWVDFPGAHCRDGSGTGIGVNWFPGSQKVAIFLEGGGACFSQTTCPMNPSKRGSMFNGSGIYDRSNAENPLADWNYVYVPYCTGDLHAGNNPKGNVPGVGPQQFVGYANLDLFMDRLIPTFPNVTQVMITGVSAGGFGAFHNASHVARRFPHAAIVALDDSGPPMWTKGLPACYQTLTRQLWNLDATVLADCGTDCAKPDDYLIDMALHFSRGTDHATGILNAYDDGTLLTWYNYSAQACSPQAPALSAAGFEAGLLNLRQSGGGADNRFATFYVPSSSHTWLGGPFYSTTVKGTRLVDWTRNLVSGKYSDIGP